MTVSPSRQAIGHLLSLGHTEIGVLLGKPDHVPSRRKLEGARVRERHGIELPTAASCTRCTR